jgi:hypothetical protein
MGAMKRLYEEHQEVADRASRPRTRGSTSYRFINRLWRDHH